MPPPLPPTEQSALAPAGEKLKCAQPNRRLKRPTLCRCGILAEPQLSSIYLYLTVHLSNAAPSIIDVQVHSATSRGSPPRRLHRRCH